MSEINTVLFVSEESKATMKKLNYPLGIRALFDSSAVIEIQQREAEAQKEYQERMKRLKERYGDELPF